MKTVLQNLLDEFYDYDLPHLIRRNINFPMLPRKATVIIGMRRTGKTWFCYQKMQDLIQVSFFLHQSQFLHLSISYCLQQ